MMDFSLLISCRIVNDHLDNLKQICREINHVCVSQSPAGCRRCRRPEQDCFPPPAKEEKVRILIYYHNSSLVIHRFVERKNSSSSTDCQRVNVSQVQYRQKRILFVCVRSGNIRSGNIFRRPYTNHLFFLDTLKDQLSPSPQIIYCTGFSSIPGFWIHPGTKEMFLFNIPSESEYFICTQQYTIYPFLH